MTIYALDYALKEPAKVGCLPASGDLADLNITQVKGDKKKVQFLTESLEPGDVVYTEMGGASDQPTAVLLGRGVKVFRIPPFTLREQEQLLFPENEKLTKKQRAEHRVRTLATLASERPELFYEATTFDADVQRLRIVARAYYIVQKKLRIPAQLRLIKLYRDLFFFEDAGEHDEETYTREEVAASPVFKGIDEEEKKWQKEVAAILKHIPVYKSVFEPIKGCGPLIAATVIGEIGDLRRFQSLVALRRYAGYHVTADGTYPRRKRGTVLGHNVKLQQALWLFSQQVVKLKESEWRNRLDQRRAYELFRMLDQRDLLPEKFRRSYGYNVVTADFEPADCERLCDHVDQLREKAQVQKDKELKEQLTGVKGYALKRAQRYIAGKFLQHVFYAWRAQMTTAKPETSAAEAA